MIDRFIDAVDGMTARDVEKLIEVAQKRLRCCIICGQDGALRVSAITKIKGSSIKMVLLVCPSCIEKHRLPRANGA